MIDSDRFQKKSVDNEPNTNNIKDFEESEKQQRSSPKTNVKKTAKQI